MNYEETIEQLDSLIVHCRCFEGEIWEKDIEALEAAKTAVEKQIPKKPIPLYCSSTDEIIGGGFCSVCGGNLHPSEDYCPNCGQAIDWSDKK